MYNSFFFAMVLVLALLCPAFALNLQVSVRHKGVNSPGYGF